ncbi:MAG: 30S ribosomal protein S12 methylthiotransferase RimO [Clostridia bacterium]
MKIFLETLGCDKNTADSMRFVAFMQAHGAEMVTNPSDADVIMMNSCGFIEDAKLESIETIIALSAYKKNKPSQKLVMLGCLAERYQDELLEELPEVDLFLGIVTREELWFEIQRLQPELENIALPSTEKISAGSAYLKIADGCNASCTFCAIPSIKGAYVSEQVDALLAEASKLVAAGAKELILVAQDTTEYGKDLSPAMSLVELLRELVKINELQWVRLMYCYPQHLSDELIDFIATEKKMCHYLDIPLQHGSARILKNMRRPYDLALLSNLLKRIKLAIPDIVLRSTFIVGFPGETEEEFTELLTFLQEHQLDWVGAFQYSQEEGTIAGEMEEQLGAEVKEERFERLMLTQQAITITKNEKYIGTLQEVLIEAYLADLGIYQGRTKGQTKEVDGIVLVGTGEELIIGAIYQVEILGVDGYDLIGEITNESSK